MDDQSNHHEDSKSSSEETDQRSSDQSDGGRCYECVFCKRGFTTAQALGGHMNIHRKERAKTSGKPNISSDSTNSVEDHQNYGSFRSYLAAPGHYSKATEVHVNYQTYIPPPFWGSTTTATPPPAILHSDSDLSCAHNNSRYYQDLLRVENWRASGLSLGTGTSSREDDDEEEEDKVMSGRKEEMELDLELRLGH
ncbi:hypothetical protein UlMin_031595 [Ulmus minor]